MLGYLKPYNQSLLCWQGLTNMIQYDDDHGNPEHKEIQDTLSRCDSHVTLMLSYISQCDYDLYKRILFAMYRQNQRYYNGIQLYHLNDAMTAVLSEEMYCSRCFNDTAEFGDCPYDAEMNQCYEEGKFECKYNCCGNCRGDCLGCI